MKENFKNSIITKGFLIVDEKCDFLINCNNFLQCLPYIINHHRLKISEFDRNKNMTVYPGLEFLLFPAHDTIFLDYLIDTQVCFCLYLFVKRLISYQ